MKIPKPPAKLQGTGSAFYDEVCTYLIDNDLLHKVDTALVYQAAKWWELYLRSAEGLKETGDFVEYASGHTQIHPNITNMAKSQQALNILFKKLGIGEEARQKLKIMEGNEHDPMDDI